MCKRYWNEAFGKSSSFENYLLSYKVVFNFFNPVGVDSGTLHYHLTKAQVAEDSRRAIFQRRTATPAEGAKCVKNGHRYCLRVFSVLAAQCYPLFYSCPYGHHHIAELWRPNLSPCFPFYSYSKFCRKSLYLFYFQ